MTALIPNVGQVSYSIEQTHPDTDRSTAATVAAMQRCIQASVSHPAVIAAAAQALGCVSPAAPAWRKAQAIWEYVHRSIRFRPDEEALDQYFGLPQDMELLQRPELLLASRAGDCDDFTMLACSLLACVGVPSRIVTVAADRETPWRWSHVYAVALDESGDAIPMDTSHGQLFGGFGCEIPANRVFRRQEWAS